MYYIQNIILHWSAGVINVWNYLGCYLPIDGTRVFQKNILSELDDFVRRNDLYKQLKKIHQSLILYNISIHWSSSYATGVHLDVIWSFTHC